MNLFKRIGRGLTVLALAPLSGLEAKERDRRLEERFKRCKKSDSYCDKTRK
jgi:hypothetical protein